VGRDYRRGGGGEEEEEGEETWEGAEAVVGTEEEAAGFSWGTKGQGDGGRTKEEPKWFGEVLVCL
jgi:hypothetical protein